MKLSKCCFGIIPMLVWMGVIFYLSHQPAASYDLPAIPFLDKLIHIFIYTILGLTVFKAYPARIRSNNTRLACTGLVLVCFFYGITDEYHQSFISGRHSSWQDIMADTIGGLMAVIVIIIWRRSRAD